MEEKNTLETVKEKKQEKKRDNWVILLFILLLTLSVTVGYSVVSTNLTINGSTVLTRNKWNVHMENVKVINGESYIVTSPKITTGGTIVNFAIALNQVDEVFEFTVDVYNSGTIDAKLSNVVKTGLNASQEQYLEYDITYADGSALHTGDVLKAGQRSKVKVRVKYIKLYPINENDLNDNYADVALLFKLDYVQN